MERKGTKAVKSVAGIFATWLFLYPLSIVIGILVARVLGPHGKGIFAFAKIWGGFLIPFVTLGFQTGVLYFLSNNKYFLEDTLVTIYFVALLIGLFLGSIIFLMLRHNYLGKISYDLGLVDELMISSLVLINMLLMITNRVLRGIGLFGLMNLMNIYKSVLLLGSLVVFVLIEKEDYHGAIFSLFISQILALLLILISFFRKTGVKINWNLNVDFIRDSFQYGFKAYWANLANITNQRVDQFILSIFVPASSLGFYSIAATLSETPWILVKSLNPVFFKSIAISNDKRKIELTNKILRITFLFLGMLYITLFVIGGDLINLLYGHVFNFSSVVLRYYIPGALFYALVSIMSKYFLAIGKPEKSSYIQITSATIGIISYLVFIKVWGVIGAAVASSITYIFTAMFALKMYSVTISPSKLKLFPPERQDIYWLKGQLKNLLS